MWGAVKNADVFQAPSDLRHYGETGEVRDLIPMRQLRLWHIQYFFDAWIYNLLRNTRLCTPPHAKHSPATYQNKITGRFKRKMERRLLELGKKGGGGRIFDLPRVRDISPQEFYREFIVPNKPCVLEGAAKNWRCTQEWSPDFFKKNYGENPILVTDGKSWSYDGTVDEIYRTFRANDYTVGDLIDDINRGGTKYATFYPFLTYHPELYDYFDLDYLSTYFHMNKVFPWQKRFYPKLFLGGATTSTTIHCAGIINLNVQIYGEKQWELWSPHASPFLYPAHEIANNSGMQVDFRNPDNETFPLYQYADRYRTVLQAGDIIFVPAWWWHACYNQTASISTSNFIVRFRSTRKGGAFINLAAFDPWSIPALFLGNEDAAREWEVNLPKIVYQRRGNYFGQVASFLHFIYTKTKENLGFSHPRPC